MLSQITYDTIFLITDITKETCEISENHEENYLQKCIVYATLTTVDWQVVSSAHYTQAKLVFKAKNRNLKQKDRRWDAAMVQGECLPTEVAFLNEMQTCFPLFNG